MRPLAEIVQREAPILPGSTMLLGSFDGFHLGHQSLLRTAQGDLSILQCAPHPRSFFQPDLRFRIATGAAQELMVRRAGIDQIAQPRFDAAFAGLTPQAFARDYLRGFHSVRAVVVGANFRFGRARAGDVAMLGDLGARYGFAVQVAALAQAGGAVVSSTLVRGRIAGGDIGGAVALLGGDWLIAVEGDLRVPRDQLLPPRGMILRARALDGAGRALDRLVLRVGADRLHPLGPVPPATAMIALDGSSGGI